MRVKQNRPVVLVVRHGDWAPGIRLAAKHSPVHVVERRGRVVDSDFIRDAVRELGDEVVGRPVESVFLS